MVGGYVDILRIFYRLTLNPYQANYSLRAQCNECCGDAVVQYRKNRTQLGKASILGFARSIYQTLGVYDIMLCRMQAF